MAEQQEWIEWAGGECPVPADTLVQVRERGGRKPCRGTQADFWSAREGYKNHWADNGHANDVIAYRVVPA